LPAQPTGSTACDHPPRCSGTDEGQAQHRKHTGSVSHCVRTLRVERPDVRVAGGREGQIGMHWIFLAIAACCCYLRAPVRISWSGPAGKGWLGGSVVRSPWQHGRLHRPVVAHEVDGGLSAGTAPQPDAADDDQRRDRPIERCARRLHALVTQIPQRGMEQSRG
jgi:hypothetical protein